MSKMNKGQLEHLSERLRAKVSKFKEDHPIQIKLNEANAKLKLLRFDSLDFRIGLIRRASKEQLKQIAMDQVNEGHCFGRTLEASLQKLQSALDLTARTKLEDHIAQLEVKLEKAMNQIRTQQKEVYDLAVFADSSDEVLKAIGEFLGD